MRIILLVILSFSLSGLFAQPERCSFKTPHQADNWLFFQNIGLKFTDAGVTINHPPGSDLPGGKGTAAISDENGNLLLYTDGMKVWNGEHAYINAGSNLSGYLGATQSSLIVPRPGSTKDYYIFTTDLIEATLPHPDYSGFCYSRANVTSNNNQGEVTSEQNIPLLSGCTEMLTGVKHANGVDYWVVTHGLNDNSFHAFLIDSNGVNQPAIESFAGLELSGNEIDREYIGAMKLSPKGDKIAYASFGKNVIEVFSFNNASGLVSSQNPVTITPLLIDPEFHGPYYVEFSPDGSKLYYTVISRSHEVNNKLYQYDLKTGEQSDPLNDPSPPFYPDVTALQLARDGKIYVARLNKNTLGIIENPNRSGTSCNYKQDGLDLGSKNAQMGMPNFIQSYFDIPHFNYDAKCHGDETEFTILNTSNTESVIWDFGDGTTSEELNPIHIYSEAGDYDVTLTETTSSGETYVNRMTVRIHPLPPEPLQQYDDFMYLYPGSRVPLDAGEGMFSYTWQDYSSDQFYEVDQPGEIEVTVEDINCCYNSKSLEVISLAITLPNAFTPNGDDWNPTFFAHSASNGIGIENYNLKVYNLWGQMVWEANEFDQKWDGTIKGQLASSGVYIWLLGFDIAEDLTGIGRIKYKGTVTLLR